MSSARSVAVVGLGLMGGSLARELSARGVPVLGFDADSGVLEQAHAEGAINQPLGDDLEGVGGADIIVLATPVDVAIDLLPRIARHSRTDAVVTDVGSTKALMVERAVLEGLGTRFVGSHPLAGDHRSGWSASRAGLYRGVTVFVTPTAQSSSESISRIIGFWSDVGATIVQLAADEHDRRLAWISHLPQILSSALAAVLREEGFSNSDLGPGGRDMTRLADSSPAMWSAICQSNAANLLAATGVLRDRLEKVERLIVEGETGPLQDFFREGRAPPG